MKYYVNKNAQPTGEHEVHKEGCAWMPEPQNLLRLGYFLGAKEAVRAARYYFDNVDGCYYCCNVAHTK